MSADSATREATSLLERPLPLWQGIGLALLLVLGVDLFNLWLIDSLAQAGIGQSFVDFMRVGSEVSTSFKSYLLTNLITLSLLLIFARRSGRGLAAFDLKPVKIGRTIGLLLLMSALLYLGTGLLISLLDSVTTSFNPDEEQVNVFKEATSRSELLMALIALVVLAPVVEEIVFRAILFTSMIPPFGVRGAAIISSLLFGLVHVQLNAILITAVLGLLLCYVYIRTKSLLTAILRE